MDSFNGSHRPDSNLVCLAKLIFIRKHLHTFIDLGRCRRRWMFLNVYDILHYLGKGSWRHSCVSARTSLFWQFNWRPRNKNLMAYWRQMKMISWHTKPKTKSACLDLYYITIHSKYFVFGSMYNNKTSLRQIMSQIGADISWHFDHVWLSYKFYGKKKKIRLLQVCPFRMNIMTNTCKLFMAYCRAAYIG